MVIEGDNRGIVSTGDNAFNVVYAEGGFVETASVMELSLREPPELPVLSARSELFGRDAMVEPVAEQLVAGHSAQLYGQAGVGKKAIAWAVHRCLAEHGLRGHVLEPWAGEDDLEAVYQRLAGVFFGKNFLRGVDESMLRVAVATTTAHITLIDCTLSREDLSRLLETFAGCTFLVVSPYRTLPPDAGVAHHVQPLPRTAAADLLGAELGLPLGPVGLQNLQFDHAYQVSEGRPQRLLQYAQFIRSSDEWRARVTDEPFDEPAEVDPLEVSPREQAEVLAVALSEPARQVLVALATFGTPLTPAWFAAVTGGTASEDCGEELYDRRLVTRHGIAYRITADATDAVRAQNWGRSDGKTAAEGILTRLAGPHPMPEPHLLLAVTRELDRAHQWTLASQFARTAIPIALQAGHRQTTLQLYVLGQKAAGLAGVVEDAEYYLHTGEQTRKLLEGDVIAATAALLILSTPAGQAAVAGQAAQAVHAARHIGKAIRHIAKFAQAKPAVAAVTALAAAGSATAITVAATSGSAALAGCTEIKSAYYAALHRDTRTTQGLVSDYRQSAVDLNGAAAKATDRKLKAALQARGDDLNSAADAQQRAGNSLDGSSLDDAHPDVIAALVDGTKATKVDIPNLRLLTQFCPDS
ncbi:hypothetical protein ACFVT2_27395 [Streptomyces sp. NPDC058000]|uniref:hypothetical protein n=1 Tax=Streptomyces sp. NPDC058000 TaxID=3346299 RepID=UPI0036E0BF10